MPTLDVSLASPIRACFALSCLLLLPSAVEGAGWRAGVGRADLTPAGPAWLAGYAARTEPSNSVAGPILAKAMALEDSAGTRLLAVTCDLLTMPAALAEGVARRLGARYALPRPQILLAASHSHSAPVIRDFTLDMYPLDEAGIAQVDAYTARVAEGLFAAACQALDGLKPAVVFTGRTRAGFASNRRRVHPDDPIDHDVPLIVARFLEAQGEAGGTGGGAVLFAYACHNTTLQGLEACGDYAGFAQAEIEAANPGFTALFAAGCAGDQNPQPRGAMDHARQHGRELAAAVTAALRTPLRRLDGACAAAFGWTPLRLAPAPGPDELAAALTSDNVYVRRRARRLLERLERAGAIDETYPYPAQVWRLGARDVVVALAGEAVVDYALRLKREAGAAAGRADVMVFAYANDGPGYIPSERVLAEGGYEGGGAMLYYGFHGPWARGVEEAVVAHVLGLARSAARRAALAGGPAAGLVKLWDAGRFTEGPAIGPDGALYFTDIPNNRILKLAGGNLTEHRIPSGKANGLAFDARGRLIACEGADGGGRRVTRSGPGGELTVLAERFTGRRFNSPNDLTVDVRGRIYFSDPRFGGGEPQELEKEAVYRIDAPGEVVRVIDDVVRPNGLALAPGGRTLYVSDSAAAKLYAYRLGDDGQAARAAVLFDFAPGRGVDGMDVDPHTGAIYAAAGRDALSGVYVLSAAGALLDFIPTPETATNCALADGGSTLYITAGRSLYRVDLGGRRGG